MAYTRTIDHISVITLNQEQHARTCNYWYLVRTHEMAHTAFNRRDHLLRWLSERGLTLTQPLPEHGEWSYQRVDGEYRQALHTDTVAFAALSGILTRGLQNGEYVETVIATDADGIQTEHKLNPNVTRKTFDYAESRELVG